MGIHAGLSVLNITAGAFLQLSVLLPFSWLVRKGSRQNNNALYIAVFSGLFVLDSVLTRLLNVQLFQGQDWNWAGKMASLLWALIFLYTTRLITKKEAGFTPSVQQRSSVVSIMVILLALRLTLCLMFRGGGGYRVETFLYEATLPGLSEEIVFRGILLALLNRVFIPRWCWLKTRFGWGLIFISLLFGAVHGLSLSPSWTPDFNSQRFIMTGALGFVLGFLKEKSKSLLPAIVFHNLWNLMAYWGR